MRWLLVAALLTAGCGSETPLAPTPPVVIVPTPTPAPALNVSGTWNGQLTVRLEGTRDASATVSGPATQTDRALSVTLTALSGAVLVITGTLDGTVDPATFTGTVRLDAPSDQPSIRCLADGAMTGAVSAVRLTFSAASLNPNVCEGPITDLQITLTR